jgi:septum formation protein
MKGKAVFMVPALILASTSPWRFKLLRDAGLTFDAVGSEFDESTVHRDDPVELVRELARCKAASVAARHPDSWVLGADQLLFDTMGVFGKPKDPDDHLARLKQMRGRTHSLVTGFCFVGPGIDVVDHEITQLSMRADLTDGELAAYVRTGEGSGCAGGYAAEGLGGFLFSKIEGDWFNVLGLPLLRVMHVLRTHGWRFAG